MLTRNKLLASFALVVLFCSLATSVLPNHVKGIDSTANVEPTKENLFFSDAFDGSTFDSEKWQVTLNTQMNNNPAYGGAIQVNNSCIELSSSGSSFPWVCTKNNPFPSNGDFTVKFDLTFSKISDFGNGFEITGGEPLNVSEDGSSSTPVFTLWADNNKSFTKSRVSIYLFSKEYWVSYVEGWEPDAPTYNIELTYEKGVYTVYVNGLQVASAKSDIRPNSIGFGHPPVYYLPFSGEHLRTLLGGWTKIKIDSIEVNTIGIEPSPTSSASTSTELPQGFAIESNSTVSAFNFDNSGSIPQICFNISGPEGTTGYVEIEITKNFMPHSDIAVYLDGTQIDYQIDATENSWIVTFTYHHSSHLVTINSVANSAANLSAFPDWIWNIAIVAVAVMVMITVGILAWLTKQKNK